MKAHIVAEHHSVCSSGVLDFSTSSERIELTP